MVHVRKYHYQYTHHPPVRTLKAHNLVHDVFFSRNSGVIKYTKFTTFFHSSSAPPPRNKLAETALYIHYQSRRCELFVSVDVSFLIFFSQQLSVSLIICLKRYKRIAVDLFNDAA